jgi:hypothetical protein
MPGLNTTNQKIVPSVLGGLTAVGSGQNNGFPLVNNCVHEFATVGAGTAAVLPLAKIPSEISVYNAGASTLTVFPPAGGQVSGGAANAPITISAGSGVTLWAANSGIWYPVAAGTTGGGGGGGTVTSVGLVMPSYFAVTNSPVTTAGSLTVAGASQSANQFLASPNGSAGAMIPRALVLADIPAGAACLLGNPAGSAGVAQQITLGTNLSFSGNVLNGTGAGGGGITTVALTMPSYFTVTNSPLTGSGGTIAVTGASQSANFVLASPNGTAGVMIPRSLVPADLTVPASSLLGNATGSNAAGAGITLGTNLSFSGNVLNASGGGSLPAGTTGAIPFNGGDGTYHPIVSFSYDPTAQTVNYAPRTDPTGTLSVGDSWFSSAAGGIVTLRATDGSGNKLITMNDGTFFRCGSCTSITLDNATNISLLQSPANSWGSLTIPANALLAGNVIECEFFGACSIANGHQLYWDGGPGIGTGLQEGNGTTISGPTTSFSSTTPIRTYIRTTGSSGTQNGGGVITTLASTGVQTNIKLTTSASGWTSPDAALNTTVANTVGFVVYGPSGDTMQIYGFTARIR